jgi:hypothetical protein
MKTIISALVILASPIVAKESLDEGLFIPDRDVAEKVEVSGGEIVHRQKAKRLKPTRITFRPDTEDKEKFWLEMDLPVLADPGDFYVFLIGDHISFTGFVVRGGDQHGCRWALGIRDIEKGRELLKKIGEVYDLPKTNIEDKTQGEQAVSGNRR